MPMCQIVCYFILWAVVSAGYLAWLSSSYFARINDDEIGYASDKNILFIFL